MTVLEALEADVLEGAKRLLGCTLHKGDMIAQIVEVEAYRTPDDPGCHAHRGRTPRNSVMFEGAGLAYVYFNYGCHWLLNVTAHEHGNAAAVLIRAAKPLQGMDTMRTYRPRAKRDQGLLNGPGKLCAAFGITGELTGTNLFELSSPVFIREGDVPPNVEATTRIGLAEGKGHDLPWRFVDLDNKVWLSR